MSAAHPVIKNTVAWWVDRAIEDRVSSLIAVTAGLGSGKSHGACQWLYERVRINKFCQYFGYMMPIYELIHNTAIPKFRKVFDEIGLEEVKDYRVVKSPYPKIVFKRTEQEIHFLSGNRPDKIKSVEYGSGVADEPGVTPRESLERFRERIRDKRASVLQTLYPGTPEGINHFAEMFDSDSNPGWDRSSPRDHILIRQTDAGLVQLRRLRLTTYDNQEFLPGNYIAEVLDTHRDNPAYVQAYIYGIFVPLTKGGCYANYMPQKHDIEDAQPDVYRDLVLTWDFNANPLAWVSVQKTPNEYLGKRRFVYTVFHEASGEAGQLDDAVAEFAAKHPVHLYGNTLIRIFGDRTGHAGSHKTRRSDYEAIRDYLKELGYRNVEICAARQVAPEAASVEAVQRLFLKNLLFVCKRCRMFKRSLTATRWQDGVRKIEKPAGEMHTHHGDAFKYWAYQETRYETGVEGRKIYGTN